MRKKLSLQRKWFVYVKYLKHFLLHLCSLFFFHSSTSCIAFCICRSAVSKSCSTLDTNSRNLFIFRKKPAICPKEWSPLNFLNICSEFRMVAKFSDKTILLKKSEKWIPLSLFSFGDNDEIITVLKAPLIGFFVSTKYSFCSLSFKSCKNTRNE